MSGHEYALVMPFLPVASRGGPFEDEAYVAGYQLGRLDAHLEHGQPDELLVMVDDRNREQADLIAMRRGYALEVQGVDGGRVRLRLPKVQPV